MTEAEGGPLAELYVRHAAEATRLAYMLTGDRQLAEDLVQDAFVKLAGRLVHLRDPGAFDAYLRRTIVNLAGPATSRGCPASTRSEPTRNAGGCVCDRG